jgi:hypothetical protein
MKTGLSQPRHAVQLRRPAFPGTVTQPRIGMLTSGGDLLGIAASLPLAASGTDSRMVAGE